MFKAPFQITTHTTYYTSIQNPTNIDAYAFYRLSGRESTIVPATTFEAECFDVINQTIDRPAYTFPNGISAAALDFALEIAPVAARVSLVPYATTAAQRMLLLQTIIFPRNTTKFIVPNLPGHYHLLFSSQEPALIKDIFPHCPNPTERDCRAALLTCLPMNIPDVFVHIPTKTPLLRELALLMAPLTLQIQEILDISSIRDKRSIARRSKVAIEEAIDVNKTICKMIMPMTSREKVIVRLRKTGWQM